MRMNNKEQGVDATVRAAVDAERQATVEYLKRSAQPILALNKELTLGPDLRMSLEGTGTMLNDLADLIAEGDHRK